MHIKVCWVLNQFDHCLIFGSAFSVCFSISAFASLAGISMNIMSPAVELKICAITARIKNYVSIIKKKRKTRGKIVFLTETKLNTIEFPISKALIDSYINHDKFFYLNNMLRGYNEIKEEFKNPENALEYSI